MFDKIVKLLDNLFESLPIGTQVGKISKDGVKVFKEIVNSDTIFRAYDKNNKLLRIVKKEPIAANQIFGEDTVAVQSSLLNNKGNVIKQSVIERIYHKDGMGDVLQIGEVGHKSSCFNLKSGYSEINTFASTKDFPNDMTRISDTSEGKLVIKHYNSPVKNQVITLNGKLISPSMYLKI